MKRPAASPKAHVDLEGYLLGRLSGAERKRIETLLFNDDEVLSDLKIAEDDLIDRYVEGGLAAADRQAFEHHFAASSTRQERIAFRRALPRALRGGEAAAPSARWHTVAPWLGAAAALLVVGLRIAVNPGRTVTPPHPPSRSSAPTASGPQTATAPSESVLPESPVILLHGGLRRGSGRIPRFAASSRNTVRLDAVVDGAGTMTECAAAIRTEAAVVWRGSCQRSARPDQLSIVAPAAALPPGDYVLRLVRDGEEREAAEFLFRVLPEPSPSR